MLEPDLLLPEKPRPLKREEYDRLVALGVFEGERVELLHGMLVAMSPQDPGHTSPIGQLTMILVPALQKRALIRVQSPIVAVNESEPEPDLAVVPIADYRRTHPDRAHLDRSLSRRPRARRRHLLLSSGRRRQSSSSSPASALASFLPASRPAVAATSAAVRTCVKTRIDATSP